ncbi:hypothetical protein FRC16_006746 [Serendipita sp. 398]|nr:hypothetical protein FRC16_006746 [Serendipita sp. 398]
MDKGRGPHLDSWPYPMRNSSISDLDGVGLRPVTPTPKITDESSLPLDPMLTRELVNRESIDVFRGGLCWLIVLSQVFFANCHPQTLFIHRSSFLHDLSRSQVPQYLLLAVLAVATPYSARQAFRTTPSWHAGEQFALEAKRTIFHEGAISLNSPDSLETLHIKPCVELAQALCLLHANDFMTRLSTESARLLVLAQGVLKALDVHTMDNLTQIPAHKNYVRNECMRRTFWYIFHIETLASAFIDRPLPVLPEQTRVLRLPSEETLFDMPRIEVRPNMDPSYDYLSLPLDQKVCQSEFANLIRVGFIYSGVIAAIGQKGKPLQQKWLQRWRSNELWG